MPQLPRLADLHCWQVWLEADHELAGSFIRAKAKDIAHKSQMTKRHFIKAKKEHDNTIMTHMLDDTDKFSPETFMKGLEIKVAEKKIEL